jgi:hypothetical protein
MQLNNNYSKQGTELTSHECHFVWFSFPNETEEQLLKYEAKLNTE